ncbi:glycosyltransferase family 4 protein [bacterium]|nr:glycosyltransferase family 4 protein [bacterium]
MRITLINQYFPPDAAPTGLMLQGVAEALSREGHEVTILCGRGGGYADAGAKEGSQSDVDDDSFRVIRLGTTGFGRKTFLGKLIDYAGFYLRVAWQLLVLHPRPERIVALTTPPFLAVLVRFFSKLRKAEHAHWVMDLYPDVMVAHGMIPEQGLANRVLGALTRWGFGGARNRMVLTLGPDMNERVAEYLKEETARDWVPLWGTAGPRISDEREGETSQKSEEGPLVLMYSGNMGLGHRFEEFLQAANQAGNPAGKGFIWKFHGEGKRKQEIAQFITENPDAPVSLGGYVAKEDLGDHLAAADIHLVSLETSWDGTMVPSKLQGIFAIGRPVIFIGSESCSIGRWILESGGGWVVAPGDVEGLLAVLQEARDRSLRESKGLNALDYAREHFDRIGNSLKVARLLTSK